MFFSDGIFFPKYIRTSVILLTLGFLFSSEISSEDKALRARKTSKGEMAYHPYPQEGYFQAWNYSFTNDHLYIFATFLVSNLGPGTRNSGISLVVYNKENGTRFFTKEFSKDDLKAEPGAIELEIGDNSVAKGGEGPEIRMQIGDTQLFLSYKTGWWKAVSLSGGKINLPEKNRFVQADMAFSFVPTWGYIILNGEKIPLDGRGGMEHLLTNYEVYKYSRRWELFRAQNSEGEKLYTGGFIGNETFPDKEIRTISAVDAGGKLLFSAKVHKSEILESETEPFSDYLLPVQEKFYMNESGSCSLLVQRKETVGKINVLSNISSVLRFFVRLFFAKPYQLYYLAEAKLECPVPPDGFGHLPKDHRFNGIFSYYLINP
ncbi:hypothetical protein LEP1GSC058_3159 [Leptospira fainei serovar Hurstbridge str. BUT 6]|uniref:Hydroxyneurosporene synthase CrtC n=1 Tax=Leptospira fainei serovar Hurstbridge str. BUT 6 TaxID=1193011 RepID=S3W0R1_9LEPT|nr:hypothetical protein [Leptospira fainei]EPG73912.1 hypothetical protein LEP1GSC058_3159 [Leptospira fainei serovar Hurstbridge str. BUT 6]